MSQPTNPSPKKLIIIACVVIVGGASFALYLGKNRVLSGKPTEGQVGESSQGSPAATEGTSLSNGSGAPGAGAGSPLAVGAGSAGSDSQTSNASQGGQGMGLADGKGQPSGNVPADGRSQDVADSAQPATPEPTCFTLNFRHKSAAGHSDMDACSGHRNLVRIKRTDLNKKSVCVRVDGTPVHFDLKQAGQETQLTLGAVAGPASKISVRYCTGKNTCAEDCTVPKDEFMAAIGGDDEDAHAKPSKAKGKMVKWDPKDGGKDAEVSEELEAEIERELAGDQTLAVFEGWAQDSETAACGADRGTLVSKRQ